MVWKTGEIGFHGVEVFGKPASKVWKKAENGFQGVEVRETGRSMYFCVKVGERWGRMGGARGGNMVSAWKIWARGMAMAAVGGALWAAGCGKGGETAGRRGGTSPVEATDAAGRLVGLEGPARRILVTGKASFAIEDALYLFPTVRESCEVIVPGGKGGATRAGTGRFTEVFQKGSGDAGKGAALSEGNAEEILAKGPDLVLLKTSSRMFGESLAATGVREAYLGLESAEEWLRDLGTLGTLLGAEGEADGLKAYYRGVMRRVGEVTASEPVRALVVQYNAARGPGACRVPPPDWIQTWMVERAGGVPVWKDGVEPGQWGAVSMEQVLAWDPDAVLVVCYGQSAAEAVEAMKADPVWRETRAFKAGRVHAFPGDWLSWDQPDARWGLGLLWVAKTLYPQVQRDLDLEAELARFYGLYGLDEAWVAANARPLVKEPLD